MISLAIFAMQVAAMPPPVEQRVANCTSTTYASDQLVCGDQALFALDQQLAAVLALDALPAGIDMESQDGWFRRSRMCAKRPDHKGCLTAAYGERIALLNALTGYGSANLAWSTAKCRRTPAQVVRLSDKVFLVRIAGRTMAASVGNDQRSWRPFKMLIPRDGGFAIHEVDGTSEECSASSGWNMVVTEQTG